MTLTEVKRKCINLIVEDSIQAGEMTELIRSLLIHGQPPLKEMSLKDLKQEVWDRYHHLFDQAELEEFTDSDTSFTKWIMGYAVDDHVAIGR